MIDQRQLNLEVVHESIGLIYRRNVAGLTEHVCKLIDINNLELAYCCDLFNELVSTLLKCSFGLSDVNVI